jgi:predicted metal-dependent hydrolase
VKDAKVQGDAEWVEAVPRYWCGGDAFETRLLEALSLLAPEVERFVIGAVRGNMNRAGAEQLAIQGGDFVREEAEHSRVHHSFNRRLVLQGIELAAVLAPTRRAMRFAARWLPRGGQLEIAAASEHFSALLSLLYLRSDRKSGILSARTSRLFSDHARDELGHRTFVYDLLSGTGGGRWFARGAALVAVSWVGALSLLCVLNSLLKSDANPGRATLWVRGLLRLLRAGCWTSAPVLLSGWLAYLKPGFHPSQLPDH